MTHLANCPQCEHDLLVPDGVVAGSWVRCPQCRAFFQASDAPARPVPVVEVLSALPEIASAIDMSKPTQVDFSSPTWTSLENLASGVGDEVSEREAFEIDRHDASAETVDDYKAIDANDLLNASGPLTEHLAATPGDEEIHLEASASEMGGLSPGDVPVQENGNENSSAIVAETAKAETAKIELGEPTPAVEPPEVAAQRIDAWFRSAKTLADIPAIQNPDVDYRADRDSIHGSAANRATVELGGSHFDTHNDDFEVDTDESSADAPAWDDTQHMDRLLAEIESPSEVDEQVVDSAVPNDANEEGAPSHSWAMSDSFTIVPKPSQRRRERSIVRTLLMTAVGGVMGLAVGYYVLLWVRGPEIDFLGAAEYLPRLVLPSSFKSSPAPAEDALLQAKQERAATEAASVPVQPSAEKLAGFEQPADPSEGKEPAAFEPPSALPLEPGTDVGEPIRIAGKPSFTAADLAQALTAGKNAEDGLVGGRFGDSDAVNQTKGRSYMVLADLAQKLTFVDQPTAADVEPIERDARALFQKILSDEQARAEIGQIVMRWISSPNRKHGGVFLAGKLESCESRGLVNECTVAMPGGQSLAVLIPAAIAKEAETSSPIGMVGWIVNNPAGEVSGYTGTATQAVFVPELISLSK